MAWDYVFNNGCTLAKNSGWYNTDLEANRKALYTELFFLFFIYFITQVLHAFRYKNTQSNPNSVRQSLMVTRISQVRASQGTCKLMQLKKTLAQNSHGTKNAGTETSPLSSPHTQLP